jgi:ArsR family transcriptional regulator
MKPVLQDATDERLLIMLRALANPARLRLFHFLRDHHDAHCGQMVEDLPLSQSTVSEHLQRLREAGLIHGDAHGSRAYEIDEDAVAWLKDRVNAL